MSDYVGGGVTLLLIAAAIAGVLFFSGHGGPGEASIIAEAKAGMPVGADYGWKAPLSPTADLHGEVGEYH